MARVKGALQITGGIKGVSFYTMKGCDTIFMRTKGGPSKRRMKTGKEFELVRKHQVEWGACVLFSRAMDNATAGLKKLGDFNVSPVWNGLGKKIMKLDTEHVVGERSIELTKCKHVLEGYNLNRNFAFNAVFRTSIQFDLDVKTEILKVKLPRINTENDIYNVQKLPYFRLIFSLGMLSDIYFDATISPSSFRPFFKNDIGYSITNETEWLSAHDLIAEQTLEVVLPPWISEEMKPHYTYLVCAAIEFGNVGFAGKIEPVKNASCAKIMMAEVCESQKSELIID